jgi:Mce-associated membrane protein
MTEHSDEKELPANESPADRLTEVNPESENTDDIQTRAGDQNAEHDVSITAKHHIDWLRVLAYGVLPGLTLLLAMTAGFSRWQESAEHRVQIARTESVVAAKESTIAMLSYQPDSVEKTMVAARDRLMPPYKDAYTKLTDDVIIPGARHDHVSVTATVPASSSVSATPTHAVAILFVNQAAVIGTQPPINTESSIRVTLQKIGGRWLISGFDPI